MSFHFTRRRILASGICAAMMLPQAAQALTAPQAQSMVTDAVREIYTVINSARPEPAMIAEFGKIFARYSDTSYVAAYALGNDGRRASTAQKRAFSKAFNEYVARKYGKRFREFIGGEIVVESARPVKNFVEVRSTAYLRGEKPFDITWQVSERTGKPLFFNMYIEGINMLLTERTEIGSMLDRRRGDIDAMIADLREAG